MAESPKTGVWIVVFLIEVDFITPRSTVDGGAEEGMTHQHLRMPISNTRHHTCRFSTKNLLNWAVETLIIINVIRIILWFGQSLNFSTVHFCHTLPRNEVVYQWKIYLVDCWPQWPVHLSWSDHLLGAYPTSDFYDFKSSNFSVCKIILYL